MYYCNNSLASLSQITPLTQQTDDYLTQEKDNLECEITSVKVIKSHLESNPMKSGVESWLDECYIKSYVDSLQTEVNHIRDDKLLLGPTVIQLLKSCSKEEYDIAMPSLSQFEKKFVFFSLNNHVETEAEFDKLWKKVRNRGIYWSLLVYDKVHNSFFHYDSIIELNHNSDMMFFEK